VANRADTQEILRRLVDYLEEHLEERPASGIGGESVLTTDLNMDSIQSAEMLADLEDDYDVALDLEDFNASTTVGSVARLVHQALATKPA